MLHLQVHRGDLSSRCREDRFWKKLQHKNQIEVRHIILKWVQRAFTDLQLVNDSSSMTRYEDWCHPWPDHHPTTGAACYPSSPHTHLAAACFPSTCGKHLHRWSLSFSLSPPLSLSTPLIYSHSFILSLRLLMSFSLRAGKREVLIVNRERCQCQKKRDAYFWIQATRFTEAYFYHEKPTWNGTAMRSCWSNLL